MFGGGTRLPVNRGFIQDLVTTITSRSRELVGFDRIGRRAGEPDLPTLARDILGRQGRYASRASVAEEDVPRVVDALARVVEILKQTTEAFAVMETMPPTHFLAFRDALVPASGFQSLQFRQLEILLGMRDEMRAAVGYQDATALRRLMRKVAGANPSRFRNPEVAA